MPGAVFYDKIESALAYIIRPHAHEQDHDLYQQSPAIPVAGGALQHPAEYLSMQERDSDHL